jgi:hypothetical protein
MIVLGITLYLLVATAFLAAICKTYSHTHSIVPASLKEVALILFVSYAWPLSVATLLVIYILSHPATENALWTR